MAVYIQAKKDIIIKMVEGLRSQGVPELLIKVATSEEVPGLQQVPPIIFLGVNMISSGFVTQIL